MLSLPDVSFEEDRYYQKLENDMLLTKDEVYHTLQAQALRYDISQLSIDFSAGFIMFSMIFIRVFRDFNTKSLKNVKNRQIFKEQDTESRSQCI